MNPTVLPLGFAKLASEDVFVISDKQLKRELSKYDYDVQGWSRIAMLNCLYTILDIWDEKKVSEMEKKRVEEKERVGEKEGV